MNNLFGLGKHCDQPAAFVLSRNRWKCHTHLLNIENVNLNIQTNSKFPSNPALYKCLTDNPRAKKVHSTRLGVKYEVVIKRYRPYKGNNNQNLKEIMEPTITLSKKGIPTLRPFYKEYRNLEFDIVRSPQQIKRWNRLKQSIINSERRIHYNKPYLLRPGRDHYTQSVVFKQLSHVAERGSIHPSYEGRTKQLYDDYILRRSCPLITEYLPPIDKDKNIFFISDAHLEIINDNDIFFHRRTPPPDEIDDDKGRLQRPLMRNKRKKVEIPPSPGQDL
ncbi:uncharacterized protein OCT59_006095 [Rhizophagus irregularis]|uniref:uncharacterized protein n=1 Tax=Rhizophagus irregularis TaxID=588596 RepID=UPI0033323C71|nr:hypothetical protein OCT59_006095 [Rhizophagus irregularis]